MSRLTYIRRHVFHTILLLLLYLEIYLKITKIKEKRILKYISKDVIIFTFIL